MGTDFLWVLPVFPSVTSNFSLQICLLSSCFHSATCAAMRQGKGWCTGQGIGSAGKWPVIVWAGTACCPLAPLPPETGAAEDTGESHYSLASSKWKILTFSVSPTTRLLVLPTAVERETQILWIHSLVRNESFFFRLTLFSRVVS